MEKVGWKGAVSPENCKYVFSLTAVKAACLGGRECDSGEVIAGARMPLQHGFSRFPVVCLISLVLLHCDLATPFCLQVGYAPAL